MSDTNISIYLGSTYYYYAYLGCSNSESSKLCYICVHAYLEKMQNTLRKFLGLAYNLNLYLKAGNTFIMRYSLTKVCPFRLGDKELPPVQVFPAYSPHIPRGTPYHIFLAQTYIILAPFQASSLLHGYKVSRSPHHDL